MVKRGRPPTELEPEDNREVLPVVFSYRKDVGLQIPGWLQRKNGIWGGSSWTNQNWSNWVRGKLLSLLYFHRLFYKIRDIFACFSTSFFAVVTMIYATGRSFHGHFQVRAEDLCFIIPSFSCAVGNVQFSVDATWRRMHKHATGDFLWIILLQIWETWTMHAT